MREESVVTNFSGVNISVNKEEANSPGGEVKRFTSASALNVGDPVYLDANGKVAKSGTQANYVTFVGVVLGGTSTDYIALLDSDSVGDEACSAGDQEVLVAIPGSLVYMTASAAIAAGARVMPSTTAGKIVGGSTATQVIGIALEASAADGDVILVFVRYS